MRHFAVRWFSVLGLLTLLLPAYAEDFGIQTLIELQNGHLGSWSRTVDPLVPSSHTNQPAQGSVGSPLLSVGQFVWETSDPTGIEDNVAISGDGSTVAVAVSLNNFRLQVFDGTTGTLRYELPGFDWGSNVAISDNGDYVAYGTGQFLYLLRPNNSTPLWTADLGTGFVAGMMDLSRQGDYLVMCYQSTSGDSAYVQGFNTASATPIWQHAYLNQPLGGFMGVSFSADGSRVVVTGRNRVFIMNPVTGAVIWDVAGNNTEKPAHLSADGTVMVTGSNTGRMRVFRWDTGQQTYILLWSYAFTGGVSNWASATAISADGLTIAAGSLQFTATSYDGYLAVFDTYGGGVPLWTSQGFGDYMSDVSVSDDGLTICATSWGDLNSATPDIRVFEKYNSIPFYTYSHPGSANDVAMNPSGTRLVVGGKAVHNRMFGNGGSSYVLTADLEGGAVSGMVTLTGAPDNSGVRVEAVGMNRYAITDASGAYQINHIPAGVRTIKASKLGYTWGNQTGLTISNGGLVQNINFSLITVEEAPANLIASQGLLDHIQLTWNPTTLISQLNREHDRDMVVGNIDPEDPLGSVTVNGHRQHSAFDNGWTESEQRSRGSLDDPDSIRIWRGVTAGGPYVPIGVVDGSATSYADNFRVFPMSQYYYVITGVYNNGESVYSNESIGNLDASYLNYAPTVPPMTQQVTCDGQLSPGEWTDAVRVDVSDVYGYDSPDAPQTAYMYFKFDEDHDLLYVAAEDHANLTLDDNEGIGLYVDDDASGSWSYGRSGTEGNYWAYYYSTGPTLRYRSLSGAPYNSAPYFTFTDPQLGFSTAAGYMTMEMAIPLGFHEPYQIALYGPNKTPGVAGFIASRDNGNPIFHGWWPQNTPSIVENPDYYAHTSIQATLPVPPAKPENVTVQRVESSLRVQWDDPTLGVDSLSVSGLAGLYVYRNDELYGFVEPGMGEYSDSDVINGGWYEYSVAGYIMDQEEAFVGVRSLPLGIYAGEEPDISYQIWDDGRWEQFTVVDFAFNGNAMGVLFDAPLEPAKVYTVEFACNQIGPIGIAIAQDISGLPGEPIVGPYYIQVPVINANFVYHFPGIEAPLVDGMFWVILYWTPDSPGSPGIATDVNGEHFDRSFYFTTANDWTAFAGGNWMIHAGLGSPISYADEGTPAVSYQFQLLPNYPNPFNPSTSIPFELAKRGDASVTIYNLMGQQVVNLLSGIQSAGYHVVNWNGCSTAGRPVSSGIYLVRLQAGERSSIRKISLIK